MPLTVVLSVTRPSLSVGGYRRFPVQPVSDGQNSSGITVQLRNDTSVGSHVVHWAWVSK